ncbi:hypothetical protein FH972_021284 [Carpinus fangiana]|uniref:POPLD domain-containing protein n=1 Tax=Carpinus fangiana TaxID=176857 RepID=A0A5N6KPI2_9ROSI|nr:hypothetical protein FH972_021284 [Carpinus fangiana]
MRQAPILKPKFRKRQINKAWLPTHIYHAKRAHMTPPSEPLWRMAIPLSPTAKTYRPTHRAGTVRGAIAWDMSYMSTIGLSGPEGSIRNLLASIGVPWAEESTSTGPKASRWLTGTRSWNGWLHEHGTVPKAYIAPATIFWCVHEASDTTKTTDTRRQVMVRIHPSAFFQLWAETLRLSKLQRPVVFVEDLRYEIGSIELAGPAAAEAMIGTLWPSLQDSLHEPDSPSQVLSRLGNVTDASALPAGAMISTETSDPRLHHPPRSKKLNKTETLEAQQSLARLLTEWHVDRTQGPAALFSRQARHDAGHRLPTQKAINRRKSLAPPGEYPAAVEGDPKIPTLVLASRRAAGGTSTGTWTILLPWKCVLPVWYSLMYQPLSTGGNPRLGGLDQRRQLHFESGTPWFPGDYPATPAGAAWNARESTKRHEAWSRRPKGKRIEYESLDLGRGRKGEVGAGWSCEWGLLCGGSEGQSKSDKPVWHIPMHEALQAMRDTGTNSRTEGQQQGDASGLVTVKLTLLTRGVPTTCARVYRLPKTDAKLRAEWLSLLSLSKEKARHKATAVVPPLSRDAPVHERRRQLAASLLEPPAMPQAGDDGYPDTPDPDELLGFVTGGNFNLGEGRGTAIGSLALQRILEQEKHGLGEHERICIVRNVGQSIGRLARWDLV